MLSASVTAIGTVLILLLMARAVRGGFVSRFPFFYSYIVFNLLFIVSGIAILLLLPRDYPLAYWFSFLISLIVEFAILVEASDHIFAPYPAVRQLGRALCGVICAVFLIFYIGPALFYHAPSSIILLGLVKKTAVAKSAIILALLGTARYYKLRLGRSVTGILLGFSLILAARIANFELAGNLGRILYAPVLRIVYPLAWTLGALVWVVALWNYQPVEAGRPPAGGLGLQNPLPVETQLDKINDTLVKLLER